MRTISGILLLAAACAPSPAADGAPVFPAETVPGAPVARVADLTVWPADAQLSAWVLTVAPRIEAATGLVVVLADETGGVPMFWSSRGLDEGWLGFMHVGEEIDFIAIDSATPTALRETVVLHEILHALGAEHVGTGEGVLSPEVWMGRNWPITTADLELVCSVRECSAFQPEVE